MQSRLLILLGVLAGCQGQAPSPAPAPEKTSPKAAAVSVASEPTTATATKGEDELVWYEDDFAGALAAAKEQKKPLLADLWAPWCHTCLSMKSYILTRPNLQEMADRFVFLAINTEKESNAAFLQKYPVEVWPTFYVLDPEEETIQGRWLGAASPDQFRGFLKDGEKTIEQARAGKLAPDDPLALLLAGDREAMEKRYPEAAKKYEEALKAAPSDWSRRPDALVSYMTALYRAEEFGRCVDTGLASMQETGNTSSVTDFTYFALTCVERLPKEDKRVEELRRAAEARLSALASDPASRLTADDRSDAYRNLWEVRELLGDKEGARAAAEARLKVLEEGAKGYPDEVALLYDWAAAETYLYLGRPDDAITLVKKREAALPKNYNPPHYLARVYQKLERYDEALASIERAISLAYGPRKAGLVGVKADILEAQNKHDEVRAALEEQLSLYQALPEGQKQPKREAAVKERLEKLKG